MVFKFLFAFFSTLKLKRLFRPYRIFVFHDKSILEINMTYVIRISKKNGEDTYFCLSSMEQLFYWMLLEPLVGENGENESTARKWFSRFKETHFDIQEDHLTLIKIV